MSKSGGFGSIIQGLLFPSTEQTQRQFAYPSLDVSEENQNFTYLCTVMSLYDPSKVEHEPLGILLKLHKLTNLIDKLKPQEPSSSFPTNYDENKHGKLKSSLNLALYKKILEELTIQAEINDLMGLHSGSYTHIQGFEACLDRVKQLPKLMAIDSQDPGIKQLVEQEIGRRKLILSQNIAVEATPELPALEVTLAELLLLRAEHRKILPEKFTLELTEEAKARAAKNFITLGLALKDEEEKENVLKSYEAFFENQKVTEEHLGAAYQEALKGKALSLEELQADNRLIKSLKKAAPEIYLEHLEEALKGNSSITEGAIDKLLDGIPPENITVDKYPYIAAYELFTGSKENSSTLKEKLSRFHGNFKAIVVPLGKLYQAEGQNQKDVLVANILNLACSSPEGMYNNLQEIAEYEFATKNIVLPSIISTIYSTLDDAKKKDFVPYLLAAARNQASNGDKVLDRLAEVIKHNSIEFNQEQIKSIILIGSGRDPETKVQIGQEYADKTKRKLYKAAAMFSYDFPDLNEPIKGSTIAMAGVAGMVVGSALPSNTASKVTGAAGAVATVAGLTVMAYKGLFPDAEQIFQDRVKEIKDQRQKLVNVYRVALSLAKSSPEEELMNSTATTQLALAIKTSAGKANEPLESNSIVPFSGIVRDFVGWWWQGSSETLQGATPAQSLDKTCSDIVNAVVVQVQKLQGDLSEKVFLNTLLKYNIFPESFLQLLYPDTFKKFEETHKALSNSSFISRLSSSREAESRPNRST